jgi:alanine-glyoxylate transaminase/serine-glyoxylate transaminase/serine-pyruvate transaminase
MFETGHFATLWREMAVKLRLDVQFVSGDWRHGVDTHVVESTLSEDTRRQIKAVMVVHNETSTGVTSNVAAIRQAIDRVKHPALLMADTISSLPREHATTRGRGASRSAAAEGPDAAAGDQLNAPAQGAAASKTAKMPRAYWSGRRCCATTRRAISTRRPRTSFTA